MAEKGRLRLFVPVALEIVLQARNLSCVSSAVETISNQRTQVEELKSMIKGGGGGFEAGAQSGKVESTMAAVIPQ